MILKVYTRKHLSAKMPKKATSLSLKDYRYLIQARWTKKPKCSQLCSFSLSSFSYLQSFINGCSVRIKRVPQLRLKHNQKMKLRTQGREKLQLLLLGFILLHSQILHRLVLHSRLINLCLQIYLRTRPR